MHPTQTIQTEADTPAQTLDALQPHAELKRIVLTGFMGAGKTTVGRLLAERLGWSFIDLDAYLEEREGLSVPEIFARHGEAYFRQRESRALASVLGRSHVVLALGGGTPEILTNRLLLEQTPGTTTVFLNAPFPALYDRCVLQAIVRPVLSDPALAEARFRERQPLYRRLARHTVDTADQTAETTTQTLLAKLCSADAALLR
jgi:shikimate kinase